MQVPESELKSFILDSGLVSRQNLDAAEAEAKERAQSVGDILVNWGMLSSDALRRTKAYVLGIPFVNLRDANLSFDVLSLIPEPIARGRNIVAFVRNGNELEVAMLDTRDLSAVDSTIAKTGLKVLPRLTDEESMRHALLHYQKLLKAEFGDRIASEVGRLTPTRGEGKAASAEELALVAQDLSIVRIVDTLLRHAILQNASDVHVEPLEKDVLVRYRIDGALHDAMTLPSTANAGIAARIKTLANLALGETRAPQDGRFKLETGAESVSFRVSVLPTHSGEKIVMRLLRETGEGFTLDTLGFHGASQECVHKAIRAKRGLILVAGPRGSGKTTTLYTILDILNTPDVSIATIEDRVEYRMNRVNQTQTDPEIGLTTAHGLRALLRQDPDILMVGDIRDSETAALAVNAALTGHLVVASITGDTAAGAVLRLLDMGIESSQIARALTLVVGQRLARGLCDPKEAYSLDASSRIDIAEATSFKAAFDALVSEGLVQPGTLIDTLPFYKAVPSALCDDGYRGHTALQEVLPISPAIRDLILEEASAAEIETQARKEGMLTLLEDGIYKATRGFTSLEEVLRIAT
ncbi:MAG: GspE/PulE family protein [Patescibacteria group bacterium]